MPAELGELFEDRIAAAAARLSAVSEEQAAEPFRPGGWQRKELLGHLLDSAANNHQRFVRAALDGHYEGPGYQQEAWVRLHDYAGLSWAALVASWRERNALLARAPPPKASVTLVGHTATKAPGCNGIPGRVRGASERC